MTRARKRFGQHFLEPAWIAKVVRAIDPQRDDVFVEIGPGHGALTRPLAAGARKVIAYEIDRDLVSELRETMPANVTIVEGDFLETFDHELLTPHFQRPTPGALRVAGNLPYNMASRVLFALTDAFKRGAPLGDATLMLQRDVADRLTADPGGKAYGVLAVLIRHTADVSRLLELPPGAFRPAPKVHSALVRLRFRPADPPVVDGAVFSRLVRTVFTRRRKTLANALLGYRPEPLGSITELLTGLGIDGRSRPETLSIAEFARLADALAE